MNLVTSFKLPHHAVNNLQDLIRREHTRLKMEIDAAQSLSDADRRLALKQLKLWEFQNEELARHFEVDLKERT